MRFASITKIIQELHDKGASYKTMSNCLGITSVLAYLINKNKYHKSPSVNFYFKALHYHELIFKYNCDIKDIKRIDIYEKNGFYVLDSKVKLYEKK